MAASELAARVARWRRDPAFFAKTVLGIGTLWAKQIEILEALRDHRRVAVPSCHESGKALTLDTSLPTPGGWTTMEAVSVGDVLLDEKGRPARVIATSPIHERECFAVRFSDGSKIIASDDHRWALHERLLGVVPTWDGTRILTTKTLAQAPGETFCVPACHGCDEPRVVVSVRAVGVHRVKCVMVDSPRSLYLAGEAKIPTHNTFVASVAAVHHLLSHQPSKVITTAPTNRQVKDLLWSEIRARHAGMKRHLGGDPGLGSPSLTHWQIPNEADWFATGFATSPDKAQESAVRMSGYHSPNLLVILDEAGGIDREVWAAVDSLLTSGSAKVLAIGNPSSATEFERICRSPDWHVRRISAYDCPNVTDPENARAWGVTVQWIDEMRRRWGEGSVVFQTKVLGLFPESSIDTLISIAEVEHALSRVPPQEDDTLVSLGVDVARFGNDETVIVVRRGGAILRIQSWVGQDTMKTAGCVIDLARAHGLDYHTAFRIAVDDTGVGGGVVDRLYEQQWKVRAVNFGAKPAYESEQEKFVNLRTELWWRLRNWIRNEAALSTLDSFVKDILRADLCAPKYEMKSDGRVALEQKSKIRQRTGRSPDYGDALALAVTPGAPRLKYTPSPEARERAERMAAERRFRDRLFREMLPSGRGLEGMLPTSGRERLW